MKKMICCLALITGCYLVSEGKNEKAERQVAVVRKGEVFKVIYKSAQQSVVQLKITDETGKLVHTEKIEFEDGFMRPYNFSQLPRGDYNLSIEDEAGTHKETLCFEEGRDCQDHSVKKAKTLMAGFTKVKGAEESKYLLTIPRQAKDEVAIRIFDRQGNLVFSEVETSEEDFARVYNLKNVDGAALHVTSKSTGEEKVFPTDPRD